MPLALRACPTVEWSCPPRRTRSTTVRNVFTGWFDKFAAGALGIATRDCRSYVGRSVACVLPCRRGLASAEATRIIQKSIHNGNAAIHSVYNIAGGLNSWVVMVDLEFPQY